VSGQAQTVAELADLRDQVRDLTTQLEQSRAREAALCAAIDRDKTGLAKGLEDVRKQVAGRRWICEGRGSFGYGEEEAYRRETGYALDAIDEIARKALSDSGTLANQVLLAQSAEAYDEWRRMQEELEDYRDGSHPNLIMRKEAIYKQLQTEGIAFVENDGTERRLAFEEGDPGAGIFGGWYADDDRWELMKAVCEAVRRRTFVIAVEALRRLEEVQTPCAD
jgi:hypothetical protein